MPKIREHKRPAVQALLVSPWQSRKEGRSDSAAVPEQSEQQQWSAPHEPRMYTVVTSDVLLASCSLAAQAAGQGPCSDQSPCPPQQLQRSTTDKASPVPQHTTAKPLAGSLHASEGGWHHRKKLPAAAVAPVPPSTAATMGDMVADQTLQQQQQQQQCKSDKASQSHQQPARLTRSCSYLSAALTQDDDSGFHAETNRSPASNALLIDGPDSQATAEQTPPPGGIPVLQGVAQLVLHPSGSISGHFVTVNASAAAAASTANSSSGCSSQLCLSLQGKQVLGIHSCYRDPEWALIQLSVIRYNSSNKGTAGVTTVAGLVSPEGSPHGTPHCQQGHAILPAGAVDGGIMDGDAADAADGPSSSSQAEVVAWVQRTGGDLVTLLPADLDDEDTEAAVLADNLGELPVQVEVNFTAHTLLSGAAAVQVLQRTWPDAAATDDVVVNLGDMRITGLPAGFLSPG